MARHPLTLPATDDGRKLPAMVGSVIYIRVSTKEQTENLSLATQLKTCEEYCERQGFDVLERFREEGESAKTARTGTLDVPCASGIPERTAIDG
jgi:hypothetical protein